MDKLTKLTTPTNISQIKKTNELVDKVNVLVDQVITDAERTKLKNIADGANKTIVDASLSSTSTNPVQNKIVNTALSNKLDKTAIAVKASKLALSNGTADAARFVVFQDSNQSTSDLTACYNANFKYNPVSDNLTVGKINGYTINSSVPANAKFTDTIYSLPDATTSVKGGIKVGSNLTVSSGTLSLTKANVTSALGYTPPTTNTDTHYTTGLKVGASNTATANAAATNGNVYLNVLDNTTVRDSHKIVGSGATTVTSDANGVITINSSNTTYGSLKNPYALTLSLNGTSQGAYDGSAAKSINITPSSIGAAASSHTHSYLPLSGGTMTGTINGIENKKPLINFRPNNGNCTATVNYDTSENEALAFNFKSSITSFMVNTGVDGSTWTSAGKWTGVTPALQVKQNSVYINELIPSGATPAYKLNVNGDTNLKGSLKLGGGCTLKYDSVNECVNFVFE